MQQRVLHRQTGINDKDVVRDIAALFESSEKNHWEELRKSLVCKVRHISVKLVLKMEKYTNNII